MLAELAAANAAFAVIKQAVRNGREIADCGKAVSDFVSAKDTLQRRGTKKKNSIFNNTQANDLEEFMALEKIRQQEEELKQYMIYAGRPGLWNDWIKFQAQARVRRQKEAEERKRKIARIGEILLASALIVLLGILATFFVWIGLEYYRRT